MSADGQAQIIQPSNALRVKVGGRLGALDGEVLARAEAALKSLSGQFAQWLQDEIDKLEAARADVERLGLTQVAGEALYIRAHDLKGLGGTYEFPLITRLAASLCKLLDSEDKRIDPPMYLIDAHIHAIKAAVRDGTRDDTHPIGRALAEELEQRVREFQG